MTDHGSVTHGSVTHASSTHATAPAVDPGDVLSSADVDRAFGTAVTRGRRLVRRRRRVGTAIGGLGVVAVVVGSFGLVRALATDEPGRVEVSVAAPSATEPAESTEPAEPADVAPAPEPGAEMPLAPDGFVATELPDGTVALQNAGPPLDVPTVSAAGGVELGSGVMTARVVEMTSGEIVSPQEMRVRFECQRGNDRIDTLRYRLDGSVVTVDATITAGGANAPGCGPDGGATIDLRFPAGDLPLDAVAEVGRLEP